MSDDHADRHEPMGGDFIRRWSRRKLGLPVEPPLVENREGRQDGAAPAEPITAEVPAATRTPSVLDSKALDSKALDIKALDIEALDFDSDYRRLMAAGVPDELRNRALHKLWTSNPVISTPDELDDYLEDFSEQAMAVPAELLRSAYEVGRGLLTPDEIAASGNGETCPADASVPPEQNFETGAGESATLASAERPESPAGSDVEVPGERARQP